MESTTSFRELGLSEQLLEAINAKGFEEPTAIQRMTIPVMLGGKANLIAQAQTGTGKTAAFGLPLIETIDPGAQGVQTLILTPTRELAIQVAEEINSLRGRKQIQVVPIYGGQSIDQQFRRLKKGVHVIVGTPGRVIDHLHRKTLKLDQITHLVLDEADEMLNMGFIEDVEEIMKHANPERQTLLFSATMPPRIKELAGKYMNGYELLKVARETLTSSLTEQIYFEVRATEKFEALCRIVDIEEEFYGLIFCRTKVDVDTLESHLQGRGYDAAAIHGDVSQAQREKTLEAFRRRRINILVATDVAARGIDVSNLTHVINYSLPQDPEAYVHRIGRTGRAGNTGTAITFITPSEYKRLMFIQRFAKTAIKKSKVPGIADVIKVKREKISAELTAALDQPINQEYYNLAKKLLENRTPTEILAATLNYCFEAELSPENYGMVQETETQEKQLDRQGKARLFVALGKKDNMTVKKLVDFIMKRVQIPGRQIVDIQIMDTFSFITVPFNRAEEIIAGFKGDDRKKPLITRARNK